jgi:hypothetical protein
LVAASPITFFPSGEADGSGYVVDGGGSLLMDAAPGVILAGGDDDRVCPGPGAGPMVRE